MNNIGYILNGVEREFDIVGRIAHCYNLLKLFLKFIIIGHFLACIW